MNLKLVDQQQTIGLNEQAMQEWREYRDQMGKPLTPLAEKKTINKLLRHPEPHQQFLVDTAIERDWRGIYEIDPPKQNTTRESDWKQELVDTSWAH